MYNYLSILWWESLSVFSLLNIAFISSYIYNSRELVKEEKKLLSYSFIYTVVCAVRSFWPRKDVEQICFIDSRMSTPFVGRSLATIAEIFYVFLIINVYKNIINYVSNLTKKDLNILKIMINNIYPLVSTAELFSWLGCISKYYLWNAIEESLWMISSVLLVITSCLLYYIITCYYNNKKIIYIKKLLKFIIIFGIPFVLFMIVVDVPMYVNRWNENINGSYIEDFKEKYNKLTYQSLVEFDTCKKISKDYSIWRPEMPWLTGYFTLGVWSSHIIAIWYINFTKIKE